MRLLIDSNVPSENHRLRRLSSSGASQALLVSRLDTKNKHKIVHDYIERANVVLLRKAAEVKTT